MALAVRELEAELIDAIEQAGATVQARGRDGKGHKTVTFEMSGHIKTFHYGSSSRLNGPARRNITTRLRRILRDLPAPTTDTPKLTVPPPVAAIAGPTKAPHLNAERRREIGKRYIALNSITKLSTELDMPELKLVALLKALKGEAARRCSAELDRRRAAAKKSKLAPKTPDKSIPAMTAESAAPKRRLRGPEAVKRNIEIAKLFYRKQIAIEDIAAKFDMTPAYAHKLAHDTFPMLHRKAA